MSAVTGNALHEPVSVRKSSVGVLPVGHVIPEIEPSRWVLNDSVTGVPSGNRCAHSLTAEHVQVDSSAPAAETERIVIEGAICGDPARTTLSPTDQTFGAYVAANAPAVIVPLHPEENHPDDSGFGSLQVPPGITRFIFVSVVMYAEKRSPPGNDSTDRHDVVPVQWVDSPHEVASTSAVTGTGLTPAAGASEPRGALQPDDTQKIITDRVHVQRLRLEER